MQTIKLNLIPGSVLPVVNVSQYDVKRQFALSVYEGATAYDLTGKSVEIRGTKPDGNGFAYDAQDGVVSVSGNTVTISTTQQMTAVGGQTMAELRITSGDTILGTINFILDVEHSALSDDTPISETEIPVIERDFAAALEEAQEAAETATTKAGEASTSATSAAGSATSAAADALKAEGYAVGKQNGSPVESESPYYLNNAEYYARHAGEQAYNASQSATAAGNSATAAAGDSLEAEGFAVGEQNGTPVGPDSPYYHNNAAYYAQEAGQHASGGIIFKGSLAFADLPTVGMASGDEYNITDDFTTDSRFIEGAGLSVKAGTNIAWVAGNVNKWDILATGGGAETLSDLTDVTITSAADGDLLQYNGTSGEWENSNAVPQKLASIPRPNLLKNWNFSNPVNTQGQSSYTGVSGTPTIDNFTASRCTVALNSGYITITRTAADVMFGQRLTYDSVLSGKKMTASVLLQDGTLSAGTFTCPAAGSLKSITIATSWSFVFYNSMNAASPNMTVHVARGGTENNPSISIVAAKLEIGEGQTLCHKENGVWVLNEVENTEPWQNTKQISAMQEAGAVNGLKIDGVSSVVRGITYTVDAEAGSININGTNTYDSQSVLGITISKTDCRRFAGKTIAIDLVNYLPSVSTGYFQMRFYDASGTQISLTLGARVAKEIYTVPASAVSYTSALYINIGATINNLTIYPMIYDARLDNPPYQPYTMTNRELTDGKADTSDFNGLKVIIYKTTAPTVTTADVMRANIPGIPTIANLTMILGAWARNNNNNVVYDVFRANGLTEILYMNTYQIRNKTLPQDFVTSYGGNNMWVAIGYFPTTP